VAISVRLNLGDCLHKLKKIPENSVDAVITDPPYGLGEEPDIFNVMVAWLNGKVHRSKSGFMGKKWDGFVPDPVYWKEVYRVLKPGGHALIFAGTRTFDWMGMSLRFAGFEIRDTVQWLYGSGFPKSLNISKSIDKAAGAKREIIGKNHNYHSEGKRSGTGLGLFGKDDCSFVNPQDAANITAPATDEAKKWDGFGTALKPAHEPILLCRKPLSEKTVVQNVLKHGTGGINIDGCRVDTLVPRPLREVTNETSMNAYGDGLNGSRAIGTTNKGRFPANIIFSHHPECELVGSKEVGSGNSEIKTRDRHGFRHGKQGASIISGSSDAPDQYGKETVENWQCHSECAIRELDEQSGNLKSGGQSLGTGGGKGTNNVKFSDGGVQSSYAGQEGGASRFFKNFEGTKGRFPANIILSHHPECELTGTKEVKSDSHTTYKPLLDL